MSAGSSEDKKSDSPVRADFGSPLGVIGRLVLAFFTSQLIAAIFLGIFLGLANVSTDIENSAGAQFVYVLLAECIAVGLIYLFLHYSRNRLSFRDIGLGRWPQWRDLKSGLLGFGAFYALLISSTIVLTSLIPSFDVDQAQDVGFNTLNTSLDKLIAFAALVLLPPIGEEILMRGYLYTGLRSRLSFIWAMLVTSAIFGLAHLEFGRDAPLVWVAAIHTFILSVVLVYVRERTGALYSPMLVHGLNNSVAFVIYFV